MTDAPTVRRALPRVLVLSRCSSEYNSSRGGVDVLARRHAELLADQGVPVLYVGTSPLLRPGVESVVIRTRDLLPQPPGDSNLGPAAYLANEAVHVGHAALSAANLLRAPGVDLVVSNSSLSTLLLKLVTRRTPVVHYVHDGIYIGEPGPVERRSFLRFLVNNLLEKLAIRAADHVICASDVIAHQAADAGVPTAKLSIMYPVLGRAPSSPKPGAVPPWVQALRPYVLSVGQQTGRKRFDLVIRALRQLPSDHRLVLVGDGPLHPAYRLQAEEEGVADRVVFRPDVSDEQLDQLYQSCSAYVLASENEGFPITVAEALLHGRPVILACPSTSRLGREFENEHFAVLENLSEEALAAAVGRALRQELRSPDEVRQSIRQWATARFPTAEHILEEYEGIFRSLARPVRGAPAAGPA